MEKAEAAPRCPQATRPLRGHPRLEGRERRDHLPVEIFAATAKVWRVLVVRRIPK
ncbi:MAG: hypothetical protein AB7I79_01310 [Rhizobiaceae bacterium]